jgi:hypothetical protein
VVVACGSIHTPLLLRRNRLGGRSGELGRNLAIHPATAVRALFDEEVDMGSGVPQSYYVDEFADERIMFEGAAGPPDYVAMSLPFAGERHRELMLRYRNLSQFGLMVSDVSRGFVRERAGRAEIHYQLGPEDVSAFKRGIELLTELYWAAGASAVYQPVESVPELLDGDRGPLQRLAGVAVEDGAVRRQQHGRLQFRQRPQRFGGRRQTRVGPVVPVGRVRRPQLAVAGDRVAAEHQRFFFPL